jgi:hypothetical protein
MVEQELVVPGVTKEGLAALLERHNLGLFHSAVPLNGGEVNPMLLVNGELVVRLNQRDLHLPKCAKEALIYRRFRREASVPCPEALALDTRRDLVPFDVLVLTYVEGVQGSEIWPQLDLPACEELSEELGGLFGSIHELCWPIYGDFFGLRSIRWIDVVMHKLLDAYVQVARLKLVPQPFAGCISHNDQ